jgi:hypothetical protein
MSSYEFSGVGETDQKESVVIETNDFADGLAFQAFKTKLDLLSLMKP